MSKFWVGLSVLVVFMAVLVLPAPADDEKPSIKDIMTKAHKGGDSLIQKIGKALKAPTPAWDDVQKNTKELVKLGQALGKNMPPMGEKESWEKFSNNYVKNAQALATAVESKDRDQAVASHKKLVGSCAACHKAHKQ